MKRLTWKAYQTLLPTAATMLLATVLPWLGGCTLPEPAAGMDQVAEWQPPADATAWGVDADASRLELRVYRAGPLASFGHNHVIEFPVEGAIYRGNDIAASGFRLVIPLAGAVIDRPAARASAGDDFAKEISDAAREGTRNNLLGSDLLDVDNHPEMIIESVSLAGPPPDLTVRLRIRLKEKVFERNFEARLEDGRERLMVDASFTLTQTGLGLEQYSALGGGLKVQDDFDVRLHVEASR